MRRLVLVLATVCGCVENPAWQDDGETSTAATSAASSGISSSSGGEQPTTSATTTTAAGTEGSTGASDESTSSPVATDSGELDTGTSLAETGSTGEPDSSSSTGAPVPECQGKELIKIDLDFEAIDDAGVVPGSMGGPCPWNGGVQDCGTLNFGTTGYFRLVNDKDKGRTAALLRFRRQDVLDALLGAGADITDVIGARIELVVWEPKKAPDGDMELQFHLLHPDHADWAQGGRDAGPAVNGDSSALCRTIVGNVCQAWALGDALAGSKSIGTLKISPALVDAHDLDEANEYHAHLMSELLDVALVQAFLKDGPTPSVGVTIASKRALAEGSIGIKLKESPHPDPALYFEVCTD